MRTWILLVAICLTVASGVRPAAGQPVLDRLEKMIRQRVAQEAQPEETSRPAAAEPARPLSGVDARRSTAPEPAYLGAIVNDERDRGRGVRVVQVHANSPAADAGFAVDDLIVGVDGVRVRQMSDLEDMMRLFVPQQKSIFEVVRGGKSLKLAATLGQRDTPTGPLETVPTPAAREVVRPPQPDSPAATVPGDASAQGRSGGLLRSLLDRAVGGGTPPAPMESPTLPRLEPPANGPALAPPAETPLDPPAPSGMPQPRAVDSIPHKMPPSDATSVPPSGEPRANAELQAAVRMLEERVAALEAELESLRRELEQRPGGTP
ncbi:MAG: PDZ domain-containing protein [Planctomycetota bacterium]